MPNKATEFFAPEDRQTAADKVGVGSPFRTAALRDRFNLYKGDGGALPWAAWLKENGYEVDASGNAYRKTRSKDDSRP